MKGDYPVQLEVEYGDGSRNQLTTLFRWPMAVPVLVLAVAAGVSHVSPAILLMILFRKRFSEWLFHHQLALSRFEARVLACLTFLVDEYPPMDDAQSVHLEMRDPEAEGGLRRFLPLFKWILAAPDYFILAGLLAFAIPVLVAAWISILVTGRYPQWLFNYVVGTMRWTLRVLAYALFLVTDRYPPFRMSS